MVSKYLTVFATNLNLMKGCFSYVISHFFIFKIFYLLYVELLKMSDLVVLMVSNERY